MDSEIIKSILQGDKEQFRGLVEKYQQMVFTTCLGFVHNKDDADDLSQEVFLQAYQALPGFRGDSQFSTWLYRIAVNASLNKVREKKGNFIFQTIETLLGKKGIQNDVSPSEIGDPENIIIRKEHSEWLQRALDSLPENQRTAIILSKYDDLPQKEIAAIMKTTEGAVEALLHRAKLNLREKLSRTPQKKNKISAGKK